MGILTALVLWWIFCFTAFAEHGQEPPSGFCTWEMRDLAVADPLCGLPGDPQRGRAIAADPHAGNCLACHRMPIPEEAFHGTIGPPLEDVGARYSTAQLRARVVDERRINPFTIMPSFHVDPSEYHRVAADYWGKPFLTAQQIEDLVAYLETLQ